MRYEYSGILNVQIQDCLNPEIFLEEEAGLFSNCEGQLPTSIL